jgi:hypothetical protein
VIFRPGERSAARAGVRASRLIEWDADI